MKTTSYFLIFLVFVMASCGGAKKIAGSNVPNSELSVKNIINAHEAATPDFKTLAARVQVVYEDEKRLQSITTSVRMEKDKIIWIKASVLGVTLAKILITPERVSYYETLGSSYFDGDFELLSKMLGTEIDFEKAQAILLGQSILDLKASDLTVDILQNKYKLQPKRQQQNFIFSLLLHPENYKVASVNVSQPSDSRLLTIRYGDYQLLEGSYYPSTIELYATEKEEKTKIDINYKKIELNVSISFPFDIPEGYEEIKL